MHRQSFTLCFGPQRLLLSWWTLTWSKNEMICTQLFSYVSLPLLSTCSILASPSKFLTVQKTEGVSPACWVFRSLLCSFSDHVFRFMGVHVVPVFVESWISSSVLIFTSSDHQPWNKYNGLHIFILQRYSQISISLGFFINLYCMVFVFMYVTGGGCLQGASVGNRTQSCFLEAEQQCEVGKSGTE